MDDEGGRVQFAGQRAIVLDTVALGFLQKYLIENFGRAAARAVMTQFGFAHGWRLADALSTGYAWETGDDWRRAGLRIMSLQGLFSVRDFRTAGPHHQAILIGSYEAEQHMLQFGRGSSVACWTIGGLLSGYASRVEGEDRIVLEGRCTSKGDAACHFEERPRGEWSSEHAEALRFFEHGHLKDCLDGSLVELTEAIKRTESHLLDRKRILSRVATRDGLDPTHDELHYPIHRSEAMSRVVDIVRRVAKVDSTVLITGESGTGKERIARLVHDESSRSTGPFVAVNCSAMTETLLESEFFGHSRGAFTGANQDRPGLFEAATKGTLFLDEVGETSPGLQVKLLRVLQEREVRRVGENHSRKIDVRVVAATNKDLRHGDFRQDLFFRLNVVEINVPALRERHDDILPLARLFLEETAHRMMRSSALRLSPAAAHAILAYDWPGNVRELQNAIERAVAMAEGDKVEVHDLPSRLLETARGPSRPPPALLPAAEVQPLATVEREHILQTLARNAGNQAATAEQLQIGTATLYRKLKSYGATNPRRVKVGASTER